MVDAERSCLLSNGERRLRLTVIGLGFIVATAMLSHGWGELRAPTGGDDGDALQNAASALILAGVIMAFGALLTIWNPPGTFILHALAGLLAIVAATNGLAAAWAYGAVALVLGGMAVMDSRRNPADSLRT